MNHLTDDELVLHYYGEPEAASGAAHLDECAACGARLLQLQQIMAAVDAVPTPELPAAFELVVWARLESELPARHSRPAWLLARPAPLAWAAAIVLLVAGAFFAGRATHPVVPEGLAHGGTADQIREGVLLSDLTEHLHRSQTMLVELVSAAELENEPVDISLERSTAEELVVANRLYRQMAAERGDAAITALLEDLERLLVELAAAPDQLSPHDMHRVQQQITAKDLLFKVRVVSAAVRSRQEQQIRTRAGQSS